MKDAQIKDCLAFEDSDLLANRSGKLSENQSKRIKEADRFVERFLSSLFLVFLAGGIFVGILAFSARNNIGLWAGMVILFLVAIWLFRGVQTEVDDAVQKVEGEVNFVKVEKKTGLLNNLSLKRTKVSSYEMRVGEEVFGNANPALIEYMQGGAYIVYFTKTPKRILSVEPVSKDK